MSTRERDILLLCLAAAAGASDGWSYMGLGHAFVANMTGNTVLLGLAIFQPRDLLHPLVALCFYAVGAAFAAFLTRTIDKEVVWHRAVSGTLAMEAVLLGASAIAWAVHTHSAKIALATGLLCVVAFAIGMQSATMLRLQIPGIVTTYITGTWTTMVSGLVKLGTGRQKSPLKDRLGFQERILLQLGIVAVYFLAAVFSGWIFLHDAPAAGALPFCAVLFCALYGFARG